MGCKMKFGEDAMRVIGISGSPRKDGNTDLLVRQILDGAASLVADTAFYRLTDMNIQGCTGCYHCREHTTCRIQDDMSKLYDEVQNADAVVLGSPVYMFQVTGQTKCFMDRLLALINPDFSSRLKGPKKLLMAYTQGHADRAAFQKYFDLVEQLFDFMGFTVQPSLVATGTHEKGAINHQVELMAGAMDMGRKLVAEN